MNAMERLRATLRGRETDRTPVIPELFGVTAALCGVSPRDYARSGEAIAHCQLAAQKLIGHDALFAMADLCVEAEALGCSIAYPDDNYPYVLEPIITTPEDINHLKLPDVEGAKRMPELITAIRLLKKSSVDIPVIACATGPITLAARIMDIEKMLYLIVDEPDEFRRLLAFCETMADALIAVLQDAGADGVMIFDPAASPSVLPEKIFTEFELAPIRSLFAAARARRPDGFTWYSVAGPTHTSKAHMSAVAADIMTVDYVTPIEQALDKSWPSVVNGNIKPQLFVEGSVDDVRHEADRILRLARPVERFILGSGCEIPLNSKEENIRALVEAAEDESTAIDRLKNVSIQEGVSVTILPHRVTVPLAHGGLLVEAIKEAGISITRYCNNSGSCGRCRVKIKGGSLSPPGEVESLQLVQTAGNGLFTDERLACLTHAEGDVTLYIPQETRIRKSRIARDQSFYDVSIDQLLERYGMSPLVVGRPLDGVRLANVANRTAWLRDELSGLRLPPDSEERIAALTNLAETPMVAVVDTLQNTVIDFSTSDHLYGLAIDIGTSNITAYLLDLESGELLSVGSIENPQVADGFDIISRAATAANDPEALGRLQENLLEGVNRLIGELFFRDCFIDPQSIYAITLVGNPVITHLFFGLNPEALAQSPFVSTLSDRYVTSAENLGGKVGINVNPACLIVALPSVGGFVGSDTVAGILGSDMRHGDGATLFIDIGTNGEVALLKGEKIYTTSTASGPVFESLHLSCAYPYQRGVIKCLSITDTGAIKYETVGGVAPIGLCGLSVIDTLAAFIEKKIIDSRGRFINKEKWPQIVGGHFVLAPKEETAHFRPITISAQDIEETQKAISAFRTGIAILLAESGVAPEEVAHVYISGSFGFSLNVANARAIGVAPDFPAAEYHLVKNSAGIGARIALLSGNALGEADKIVEVAEHINIANHDDFFNLFIDNMFFPS